MAIIAIDPGKTTGFVVASSPHVPQRVGEVANFGELRAILEQMLKYKTLDVIVCESFSLYAGKKDAQSFADMPSSQMIGMLKEWSHMNGVRLELQSPAARKVITPEMFKATCWHKATRGYHHAKDAAQHLLLYFLMKEEWQASIWQLFEEAKLVDATNMDTE